MLMFLDLQTLKQRAEAIGLSLGELADLAEVSRPTVYRALKHKTNIGLHKVLCLNKVLLAREEELRKHLEELNAA